MKKIVMDTVGADAGLQPVVVGTARALKLGVEFFPVLVGPAQEIRSMLEAEGIEPAQYELVDATDAITRPGRVLSGEGLSAFEVR